MKDLNLSDPSIRTTEIGKVKYYSFLDALRFIEIANPEKEIEKIIADGMPDNTHFLIKNEDNKVVHYADKETTITLTNKIRKLTKSLTPFDKTLEAFMTVPKPDKN
jgi:hypothetical protein